MKLSDKIYNTLRYVALVALPAICFFLATIGDIYGFGWMPKVVATVSAVATLLGALLQISTAQYWRDSNGKDIS